MSRNWVSWNRPWYFRLSSECLHRYLRLLERVIRSSSKVDVSVGVGGARETELFSRY
jgi:hypothetical protein